MSMGLSGVEYMATLDQKSSFRPLGCEKEENIEEKKAGHDKSWLEQYPSPIGGVSVICVGYVVD